MVPTVTTSGVQGGGGGHPPDWKIQGKLLFRSKLKLLKNPER